MSKSNSILVLSVIASFVFLVSMILHFALVVLDVFIVGILISLVVIVSMYLVHSQLRKTGVKGSNIIL